MTISIRISKNLNLSNAVNIPEIFKTRFDGASLINANEWSSISDPSGGYPSINNDGYILDQHQEDRVVTFSTDTGLFKIHGSIDHTWYSKYPRSSHYIFVRTINKIEKIDNSGETLFTIEQTYNSSSYWENPFRIRSLLSESSNSNHETWNDFINHYADVSNPLVNSFNIEYFGPLTDLEAYNYIASYGDLINTFGIDIEAAKSHYENYGISEGRSLTSFSATNYLAKYSDLSAAFGDDETSALKHYIQYGFNEGRTDTSSSSVSGSGSGSSSGESSNLTDFQALNYIASNIDLISALGTDLVAAKSHYTNYGKAEGRSVDNFDEWGYLASNNDLMSSLGSNTTEVIKHYISFGKSEGRSTTSFNAQSYLNNYSDLKSAFGNDHTLATKHYVESGFNEGRVF